MENRNCAYSLTLALCATLLNPLAVSALIMVGRGNEPVHDAGWPEGALAVANLESRVGWWEGPPFGGGEWQFLYRGDAVAFNQALTNFAAIRAPTLELVIHDGPQENTFLKDENHPDASARVDWTFTVWNPEAWYRLYNNPKSFFAADQPNFRQPVAPPRLEVYIGGGGALDWSAAKVPPNVRVRDERASAAGIPPGIGAVVRADVFDIATGKPVAGTRVTVARMSGGGQDPQKDYETVAKATCDDAGHAQLEKIPAGTYRVSVASEGYAPRVLAYEHFTEHTFKSFQVELAKAVSVRGVVTDGAGQPLKGVQVRADNAMAIDGRGYGARGNVHGTTDEAGQFELAGLPAGFTQLWASAPDYYYGDVLTLYEVPTTNVVLRLTRAGKIQVSVTDKDGNALGRFQGAKIMVNVEPKGGSKIGSWGGSAEVDAEGRYEFTNVAPGEYRVTSHPNPSNGNKPYAPEQIVTIAPGASAQVRMVYPDSDLARPGRSPR